MHRRVYHPEKHGRIDKRHRGGSPEKDTGTVLLSSQKTPTVKGLLYLRKKY
jgi:hypothetical protein